MKRCFFLSITALWALWSVVPMHGMKLVIEEKIEKGSNHKVIDVSAFLYHVDKWTDAYLSVKLQELAKSLKVYGTKKIDASTSLKNLKLMRDELEQIIRQLTALKGVPTFIDIYDSSTYTIDGMQGIMLSLLRRGDRKAIQETLEKNTEKLKGVEWYDVYTQLGFAKEYVPTYEEVVKRIINRSKQFKENQNMQGLKVIRQFRFWLTNQLDKEVLDTFLAMRLEGEKIALSLYEKIKPTNQITSRIMGLYQKFVGDENSFKMQVGEWISYAQRMLEKVSGFLRGKKFFARNERRLLAIETNIILLPKKILEAIKTYQKRQEQNVSWIEGFAWVVLPEETQKINSALLDIDNILLLRSMKFLHKRVKKIKEQLELQKKMLSAMQAFSSGVAELTFFRGFDDDYDGVSKRIKRRLTSKDKLGQLNSLAIHALNSIGKNKKAELSSVFLTIMANIFEVAQPYSKKLGKEEAVSQLYKLIHWKIKELQS